jgi:hypothetical protein
VEARVSVAWLEDQPGWCKPTVGAMNWPATAARDAVFVSYSHDDQDWPGFRVC